METEDRQNSPYTFRDEAGDSPRYDPEEREIVIVEGQAMSFRWYRR